MITQFTINLNKGEDVAEREMRWRRRREVITLALLAIVSIILFGFNYQQYQSMNEITALKARTIREIDRQLDSLKKTGKNISKDDVMALAKLEKERVLWTKKLLAIGQQMPEDMALSYIEFKNNLLLIRFIGTMKQDQKEFDQVKEILDRLRSSPLFFRDFLDMRLKEQHQAMVGDQNIMSFSVVCSIEKESKAAKKAAMKGGNMSKVTGGTK